MAKRKIDLETIDDSNPNVGELGPAPGWCGGFAVLKPIEWSDYLPIFGCLVCALVLLVCLTISGVAASRVANQERREVALKFWTNLVNNQAKGRSEQGDCFYYAIELRDQLLNRGVEANFNFVHWTDVHSGQSIHVYLSAKIMDETWVMDNMGGIRRFPSGTSTAQWLPAVTPRNCPYEYLGDTRAAMNYLTTKL